MLYHTTGINPAEVLRLLEKQLFRTDRNSCRFHAKWQSDEVHLVPRSGRGQVIVTARNRELIVNFDEALEWLGKIVLRALREGGLSLQRVGPEAPKLERKFVQYDHLRGGDRVRPKSHDDSDNAKRPLETLERALAEAETKGGKWLLITETARRSAAGYHYTKPQEITDALLVLAKAAELNAEGKLGMSWRDYLRKAGFDFSPHSSSTALGKYGWQYKVWANGARVFAAAHVCLGTGSAPHCARIYVRQPDKPGDPVIVGSVGPHLDIPTR